MTQYSANKVNIYDIMMLWICTNKPYCKHTRSYPDKVLALAKYGSEDFITIRLHMTFLSIDDDQMVRYDVKRVLTHGFSVRDMV